MIDSIWNLYLKINYCGQRFSHPWFSKRAIITIVMLELSFSTCGFLVALLVMIGMTIPWVGGLIVAIYILILWKIFPKKIIRSIEVNILEPYYVKLNSVQKIGYFLLMVTILVSSVLFMIFSVKWIFLLF